MLFSEEIKYLFMFLTKTIWKFSAFCMNQGGDGHWAVYYPNF